MIQLLNFVSFFFYWIDLLWFENLLNFIRYAIWLNVKELSYSNWTSIPKVVTLLSSSHFIMAIIKFLLSTLFIANPDVSPKPETEHLSLTILYIYEVQKRWLYMTETLENKLTFLNLRMFVLCMQPWVLNHTLIAHGEENPVLFAMRVWVKGKNQSHQRVIYFDECNARQCRKKVLV